MSAGTTPFRSILDKPLHQLTEDDISQLTREDCRKFLKEKGMRRPSWNKSQAIQQVLSLKALYEPSDDSGAGGAPRRIVVSPPPPPPPTNVSPRVTSNSADSGKRASGDVQASVSVEESAPYRRKEPSKSAVEDEPIDADNRDVSPRTQCATDVPVGQMTIFYCGKVNVYDGVPPEKARTIMHLAASPVHSSWENSFGSPVAVRSFPWHLQSASDKGGLPPSAVMSQAMQREKTAEYTQQCWEKGNGARDPDGPANRKVLVQRYREKRKDRGRLKSKKNVGLTSNWEVYLKDQVKTHTSNGNSSRSSTSSPPRPGLPQSLCSTADNQ